MKWNKMEYNGKKIALLLQLFLKQRLNTWNELRYNVCVSDTNAVTPLLRNRKMLMQEVGGGQVHTMADNAISIGQALASGLIYVDTFRAMCLIVNKYTFSNTAR